jgi:hypothetical protein
MKKIFYTIAAFALTTVSAFACDDSLSIKLNTRGEFKFWEGLDIGVSGYLTPSNSLTVPSGSPFFLL